MDLKSGYPFWAISNGLLHAFPPLREDLRCDVAVIGGGITGAVVADALAAGGHDVAVLERRAIGWGSTCASTALVQYEIDTSMADLAARHGEDAAALAYRACAQAVERIGDRAQSLGDVGGMRMRSLYLASRAMSPRSPRNTGSGGATACRWHAAMRGRSRRASACARRARWSRVARRASIPTA